MYYARKEKHIYRALYTSRIMIKTLFCVCDKVGLKSAYSFTEIIKDFVTLQAEVY